MLNEALPGAEMYAFAPETGLPPGFHPEGERRCVKRVFIRFIVIETICVRPADILPNSV